MQGFLNQVQNQHDLLYDVEQGDFDEEALEDDEPVFDFDVMEAYGLSSPHHTVPAHAHADPHAHAHIVPGHHDLEKTYRTIM